MTVGARWRPCHPVVSHGSPFSPLILCPPRTPMPRQMSGKNKEEKNIKPGSEGIAQSQKRLTGGQVWRPFPVSPGAAVPQDVRENGWIATRFLIDTDNNRLFAKYPKDVLLKNSLRCNPQYRLSLLFLIFPYWCGDLGGELAHFLLESSPHFDLATCD